METFDKFASWVLLAVVGAIVRGVAISYSWNWIVVKIFETRELNITQAIALSFFVSLISYKRTDLKKEIESEEKETFNPFILSIMYNLMGLVFCYIASLFL